MSDQSSVRATRIKVTDELNNVAYIHFSAARGWCCTLSNGIAASFWYAVGNCDEQGLRFRLDDAQTPEELLQIVMAAAGPRRKVEIFK